MTRRFDSEYIKSGLERVGRQLEAELTVYLITKDERFDREYVVHGDGEYADETVHVNTCESHIGGSQKIASQSLRAFQLRRELYRKPGRKVLKNAVKATL